MSDTKANSLLVADCGSVNTKVGLVEVVAGEHRFVAVGSAATTVEPPESNILVGMRHAIEVVESRTNRLFLDDQGQLVCPEQPDGLGVDAFAAVTSAALPLRVAIVGLSREVSLASAVRAVSSTYGIVEATLALDETAGRWLGSKAAGDGKGNAKKPAGPAPDPAVIAAEKLAQTDPEVIVLVGGIDGGATSALSDLANLIASIAAARKEKARPRVIFAGNRDARTKIVSRLSQVTSLRVVDNIHPALGRENLRPLQHELEELYIERRIAQLPGHGNLASWCRGAPVPSALSFEQAVRFLSQRYNLTVWGADIGASATTLVTAQNGAHSRVVRTDIGTGYSLEKLAAQVGVSRLLRWLPTDLDEDALFGYLLNHSIRPATVPATREEVYILQAAMREALSVAAQGIGTERRSPDLLVLTGSTMSRSTDWGALALVALDALQPQGVLTVAVDALGLAPAFGAIAAIDPIAGASVIERDAFVTLGTVLAPASSNRTGQIDMRVKLEPTGGGTINLEVQHGSLELVPLAPGQKASLEVQAVGSTVLSPASRGVFKAEIEGGMLGLIIDARGRPIVLPVQAAERRTHVQQWYWDVGA